MGSAKYNKQFTRVPFLVSNQTIKGKAIVELQRNRSKNSQVTAKHLLEKNFIKATQNFVASTGKPKQFFQGVFFQELSENVFRITAFLENVIRARMENWKKNYMKRITY